MEQSKWHMHRMGLVDFWFYEEEEFFFQNGHMLLRGSNGSGKSVTMQSFIPLLLDGNRSSERIDSFGTKSRKMDTYLIDENTSRDDRIGYLYLECKREESDIYVTLGMGLHARKNKPLDVWYFVIEDNRRINHDFRLMENGLTLSKKQLVNILNNQVIDSQKEYMKKVNEVLFGFDTLEEYKDFLDLLLKLRAPKLSNSLTPVKIAELLSTSLPPLSDDDLRPMSEAINSMDALQDTLDNLKVCLESALKIEKQYRNYNETILFNKYHDWQEEEKNVKSLRKELSSLEKEIAQQKEKIVKIGEKIRNNQNTKTILENERDSLMDSDLQNKYRQLQQNKQTLDGHEISLGLKRDTYAKKDSNRIDVQKQMNQYLDSVQDSKRDYTKLLKQLEELYQSYPIGEYTVLKQNPKQYPYKDMRTALSEERKKTKGLKAQYEKYEREQDNLLRLESQIESIRSHIKELARILQQNESQYREVVKAYQEAFYKYSSGNQVLILSKDILTSLTESLLDYEISKDYYPIQQILYAVYQEKSSSILNSIHQLEYEWKDVCEKYNTLEEEYEKIYSQKEYEPQRDTYVQNNRTNLIKNGISFIPFYECIRFSTTCSVEEENYMEEVLSQLHLLDALIVQEKDKEKIQENHEGHDIFLWTKNSFETICEQEISSLFQLSDVFNSLGLQTMDGLILDSNYFEWQSLSGTIDGSIPSVLVGQTKRRRIREEKLMSLRQQMEIIASQKEELYNRISQQKALLELAEKEYRSFIKEEELKQAYSRIEENQKGIDFYSRQIDQKVEEKNDLNQRANKLLKECKELSELLIIKLSKNAIEIRLDDIDEFERVTNRLESTIRTWENNEILLSNTQERYDSIVEDLDELHFEISQREDDIQVLTQSIQNLENHLKELHFEEKMSRLESIDSQLKQLDLNLHNAEHDKTVYETQVNRNEEDLEIKRNIVRESEEVLLQYKDVLVQEYENHLVFMDGDMLDNCKSLTGSDKKVEDCARMLQSVFYENTQYLAQYHLENEVQKPIHDTEKSVSHLLLYANYNGRKIPFLKLIEILKNNIEMQNLLIQDEDRRIFEEILVNSIGKKIRERIQDAQKWVTKIEKYMQEMNTSSGLQISVRWKPRDVEEDGTLSTKKLIELLEKDAGILKDRDLKQISNHFRNRISKARKLSLDGDVMKSFHQLMKEVMDYRLWFNFVLYAKKTNETKKELTNKLFYSYSGGEKAIVMYAPLFSAVAAKFEGAKKDAPFIIALDEAFAGVDENNIDKMFELVEKFKFDYIMTSQSLWGDYPTCRSLAIYELYRPNNADYITKLSYVWNGNRKKSVFI
ncbi:MAG: hypothetical protein KBT48_03730 [Firmicutes bacterium]|nr:hypothetical protein [Bacillota bacterium]